MPKPVSAPLRIAYVINSMEGGGASSPIPSILAVLRGCGAEVKVFALTCRDGRGIAAIEASGVEVEVRPGGEKDHLAGYTWLVSRLREWRATHLWTSLTRSTLLGQLAGIRLRLPVVSWQHNAFLKPANRHLLRLTRRLSTLWVADSDAVATLSLERLKLRPDRMMVWPIFRADPGAPQAGRMQPGETLRIGSLGRLHPVKGYDVLLKAIALLKADGREVQLAIGGDGAQRERLVAQANDLGLGEVHFQGFTTDPKAFLATLHLYVQPSWFEGFCVAAHEAMQAGLPVIGSVTGELAHSIVPGVTGELAPAGSPEILALKIATMMDQPSRRAAMGMNARAMVLERFGPVRFEIAGRAVLDRLLDLSGWARTPLVS